MYLVRRPLEAGPDPGGQRNTIITLTSRGQDLFPLMHLRGADPAPALSKVQASRWNQKNPPEFDISMTLKQACPSEYQGAQGAFKDSMIH